jgi:hypothetical protein
MSERRNFILKTLPFIGIILSFFVILLLAYAPLLQTGFLHTFDYFYFGPDGQEKADIMFVTLRDGRILNGYLINILSKLYESSESSKIIRFVGIIGLALLASVIYAIFRICRFRKAHAFFMSLLICILPSLQISVIGMLLIPCIYSAFLSSLSALLMFNVVFSEESKGRAQAITGISAAIVLC